MNSKFSEFMSIKIFSYLTINKNISIITNFEELNKMQIFQKAETVLTIIQESMFLFLIILLVGFSQIL